MKNMILLIFCAATLTGCSIQQKELYFRPISQIKLDEIKSDSTINIWGQIRDGETGEALPFANIVILKGENLIAGSQTDMDGIYKFTDIEAGTYDFEATYIGYRTSIITGAIVYPNRKNKLNFNLIGDPITGCGVFIEYKVPLIKLDETTSGQTFTSEFIKRMAW